jgi:hypothetical protein
MSVYPAAIELARTDFDLPRLLSLPTYLEGGPNTHSLSLWTLVVAAGIHTFGDLQSLIPLLHVVSLALYGLLAVAVFRFIRVSTTARVAAFGTAAACLFPALLVQAGDIYIDLPAACLTTWSVYALMRRKYHLAAGLITVAIWIKPIAAIFLPALILHRLRHGPIPRKVQEAGALLLFPVVVLVGTTWLLAADTTPEPIRARFMEALAPTGLWLQAVPDVLGVIIVSLSISFIAIRRTHMIEQMEIGIFVLLGGCCFLFFNPLVTFGIPFLPRYFIAIVPVLVAALAAQVAVLSPRAAFPLLTLIGLVFVLNLSGFFYPFKNHPMYALAERSLAYHDLLALQKEGVARLEELGRSRPIFYDYYRHYQFRYPEMGYTSGPSRNGVLVFHDTEISHDIADFPPRFALLFEYPWLGGNQLYEIWQNALADGATVTETRLRRGPYTIFLIEVAH